MGKILKCFIYIDAYEITILIKAISGLVNPAKEQICPGKTEILHHLN